MLINIKFFASAREVVGIHSLSLDVEADCDTDTLRNILLEKFPQLTDSIHEISIAVNKKYIQGVQVLQPNDEIALIPPISGG
mmetsp:Transcript_12523/g.18913  ORF Transcript_12523/g.18913 Transcript_12523/m.18913 type:complete len:82 (+) Transcript_12523:210-455(+)